MVISEEIKMSNYGNEYDKLEAHLQELERKHRDLDKEIERRYHNVTINEDVRKMKTMKLFYKDEMRRINEQLVQLRLR
jgi:hypothetical protein